MSLTAGWDVSKLYSRCGRSQINSLLSPLVLTANLVLFFGSKVVGDVECLADLFR